MKTKIISFVVALIAIFPSVSSAQEKDAAANFKHEFGFDASGVVRSVFPSFNGSSFNSFMYRFNTKEISYRIRITGSINNSGGNTSVSHNSFSNDSSITKPSVISNIEFRPGMQFNHYSKNLMYYAGFDLIIGHTQNNYSNEHYTGYVSSSNDSMVTISKTKSKTNMLGISPIFGVRFFLSDRIRLSLESSANITYSYASSEGINSNMRIPKFSNPINNESRSSSSSSSTSMQFVPLNMIMLSILF